MVSPLSKSKKGKTLLILQLLKLASEAVAKWSCHLARDLRVRDSKPGRGSSPTLLTTFDPGLPQSGQKN